VKPPSVYDRVSTNRLAFLENAYNISYTKKVNNLWTATFHLPLNDNKNQYCTPLNFIDLWDVDNNGLDINVGLFRILPQKKTMIAEQPFVEYVLEHVLGLLIDEIMVGWHEVGGVGLFTSDVLTYILSQQRETRWVLDQCDYAFEFLYGWQDENILNALLSVTKAFAEGDHVWSFDTTTFPWKISLLQASEIPVTDIRYGKNLSSFVRSEDPTNIVTRIYPYGYGHTDNRLNIKNLTVGNVDYLESSNVSKYGVVDYVWVDQRYTDDLTLKEAAQSLLNRMDSPVISYKMDVVTYAGKSLDLGDTVRIVHDDYDQTMTVREISKSDVSGKPLTGKILFGKGTVDIAESHADVVERQRIQEIYSQGVESLYADSLTDNADETYPLELTFWIPDNVVNVNEINLNVNPEKFRAYSKSATLDPGGDLRSNPDYAWSGDAAVPHYHDINIEAISFGEMGSDYVYVVVNKNNGDMKAISSEPISGFDSQNEMTGPSHAHRHQIPIPEHDHPLEFGIHQGSKASSITVYVDDDLVGTYSGTTDGIDILAVMPADSNGKVARGKHIIKIVPNDLTRLECSLFVRLFTNSRGGSQS
jgi:phage minor structural protein